MKERIIIISLLLMSILVIGCDKVEEAKICIVDASKLTFEDKKGFVIVEKRHVYYDLNYSNVIYLEPLTRFIVCENMTPYEINCVNKKYEIEIECSWCYNITSDGKVIDTGLKCLSDIMKIFVEEVHNNNTME